METNKAMRKMLATVRPYTGVLPSGLSYLNSASFIAAGGCYFIDYLLARTHGERERAFDETDYECFVNRIHVDDHADKVDELSLALHLIECLTGIWVRSQYFDLPLQFIVSINPTCCVLRFHVLRPGQRLLSDDLEAYRDDAVLAVKHTQTTEMTATTDL